MVRKRLLLIPSLFIIFSCGNGGESPGFTDNGNVNSDEVSDIPMFKSYDCATCHKVAGKLIAPSFKEISERYKNAVDTTISSLALKIIKGGSGNWTAVTPMLPHPSLSKEDAEKMVKYILQINK